MGEARRKREDREKKLKYIKSIPVRTIKAISGYIFCLIVVPFVAAAHCFEINIWAWEK